MGPEEPTRRIPPTVPPREPAPVVVDERDVLADRLRSLRTALALVGLLAATALGVGLYALLTQEEEDDSRRGATRSSVNRLEERVDELESKTGDAATKSAVSDLRSDQEELSRRIDELAEQPQDEDGGDTAQLQTAIEDLGTAVEDLQQRVEAVEQQQAQGGQTP